MPAVADGGPGEIVRGMEFTGLLLRTLAVSLPPLQAVDDGGSAALDAAARRVVRRAWRRVMKDAEGFDTVENGLVAVRWGCEVSAQKVFDV